MCAQLHLWMKTAKEGQDLVPFRPEWTDIQPQARG